MEDAVPVMPYVVFSSEGVRGWLVDAGERVPDGLLRGRIRDAGWFFAAPVCSGEDDVLRLPSDGEGNPGWVLERGHVVRPDGDVTVFVIRFTRDDLVVLNALA